MLCRVPRGTVPVMLSPVVTSGENNGTQPCPGSFPYWWHGSPWLCQNPHGAQPHGPPINGWVYMRSGYWNTRHIRPSPSPSSHSAYVVGRTAASYIAKGSLEPCSILEDVPPRNDGQTATGAYRRDHWFNRFHHAPRSLRSGRLLLC